MSHPHKVHELLSRAELDDLEAFAREPGRTIDECHEWLQAHGFTLSRGAVHNWKRKFDEQALAERMSGAGSLAQAFLSAAKDGGGLAVPDAALLQIAQQVFEAGASGAASPDDLNKMALTMQRLTLSKSRLEKTRGDLEARQRKALEAGEQTAKAGGSGEAVLTKVREILGIATA
jgi:hypothetical protein